MIPTPGTSTTRGPAGSNGNRLVDRVRGAGDVLDRPLVALLARLTPGDERVPLEQDGPRRRVGVEQLCDPPRHGEPRPLVVEPDRLVAERLLGETAPVRIRGQ